MHAETVTVPCHLPADRKGHSHDARVVAVGKVMHSHQCDSHDGQRRYPAERWDRVGIDHQHMHCVRVENFFWYAEQAGHPLQFDGQEGGSA